MSNPTSNFGWQMPTATDLVTDLPADFEVFGQAVDTDFVDLLGGTTGQILSKTSATDLDFTWIANDQGDITGVTAGVGITGGGTSGTVTVTNDMATTITAAGDIVVGTGSGTYDNLPIGTTGQLLTADTTVSPYKVKWATPAASASGLTLINTTTFSGASSVAVDSVFTSTYPNYFIQTNFTSATGSNQTLSMRMRAGGTSYSGGDYFTLGGRFYSGAVAAVGGVSTGFDLHSIEATNGNYAHNTIQLLAPQAAVFTKITSFGLGYQTSPAYTTNAIHMSGLLQTTTQYDGFLMYVASGNIAGTVKVYGYAN